MTTQQKLSILDIINNHAPREWYTSNNPRSKYSMKCPFCEYDSRSGKNCYFVVSEDEQLYLCFVCQQGGGPRLLLRFLTGESEYTPSNPMPPPKKRPKSQPRPPLPGTSIAEVAWDKGLDIPFLIKELGWRDVKWNRTTPAIEIPYPDENNQDVQLRYRVALDGDRFRWAQNSTPRLYGLQFINKWPDTKLTVVEGETDTALFLQDEWPAIGVPGANNWRQEWLPLISRFQDIYFWEEPDQGGSTLRKKITGEI